MLIVDSVPGVVRSTGTEPNPLQQYFGEFPLFQSSAVLIDDYPLPNLDEENIELQSASEGEDDVPEMSKGSPESDMDDDVEGDEEEEDEAEEDEGDDAPRHSKAGFALRGSDGPSTSLSAPPSGPASKHASAFASTSTSVKATPAAEVVDDSATESDSGFEAQLGSSMLSLPIPPGPNTRPKATPIPADHSATDSETESDSGAETIALSSATIPRQNARASSSKLPQSTPVNADDSATESDSEAEAYINPKLRPKPGFPLNETQKHEKALVLDEELDIKVPGAINTYLREYQREGVKFMYRQYKEGRGGLLGDDMGLKGGVITDKHRRRKFVSKMQDKPAWKEKKKLPKANAKWPTCLIIAPSTVVHNWEREFKTWGYFEVGLYTGGPKEREPVINDFKLGRLDVVITSFDLARRDIDLLDNLPWSCIIVDEVHRVKNTSSQITQAYHQFTCHRRFGLTGTAIQNSYKELWTILDWTNPGKLGTPRQWAGYVVKPLTVGQSTGASEEERARALIVAKVLKNKLLPNFFLRRAVATANRTKDIIKDQLPKKIDEVVFCPLTDRQISAYKNLLNMDAVQNLLKRDEKCPCRSGKPRKTCCHPFVAGDVFRFMSILIKLSNHLGLILPDGNIPKYGTAMMQPRNCGKWATLEVLLREWRKDRTNKVLIFTKSVKLLEMLEFHLGTKHYGFLKLDGSTKQAERMPMIDKFNNDPDVYIFLISTLAGGTGLNLTGANKVVIFDPAHDLQAMDRAFRFGQTRDVSVYRLLGAGSVEELIYARQIYKQQQMAIGYEASIQTRYFEGVQGDTAKQGELFGINNIFKLHEDKLATKMAIEKANLAELDWALANMDAGARKGKKSAKAVNELVEADSKVGKDDIVGNMKGLGALLFDDAPPSTTPREQDVIKKTLSAIGVRYSHQNDDVLMPSKIEAERVQTLLKVRRRKSKGAEKEREASPKEQWPPRRRHHKYRPSPTPEQQLNVRQRALIRLGMINKPEDITTFARDFARQTAEERRKIIAELDEWAATNPQDSDSSD
ncbi:hypothetical protein CVT26_000154 [Gymnopilus dilepis]|uniref:Helicase ATP-binding domain-containing protein n=1 Tax=Gymnopilus dilepis TaxID=231916 RepID=A0A409WBM5_9AGAR|nr:hypothetical protein CVT26_000154 [Gymnopilus dilepis]